MKYRVYIPVLQPYMCLHLFAFFPVNIRFLQKKLVYIMTSFSLVSPSCTRLFCEMLFPEFSSIGGMLTGEVS